MAKNCQRFCAVHLSVADDSVSADRDRALGHRAGSERRIGDGCAVMSRGAMTAFVRRACGLGRVYHVPPHILAALEQVLGPAVRSVTVSEHSLYARAHVGMTATTRPNLILLAISGEDFIADPDLLLHEFFHVVAQWNTRRLTRRRYLAESLRRGYRDNCFEREARDFARRALNAYRASLPSPLTGASA